MTVERGDKRGGGGTPGGGDGRPDGDAINPDSGPATKALVPVPRARLTETGPAAGTGRPTGIATPEQLDAFRELRTRLLSMAAGLGLTHFTTLVVPATPGAGASFVARNLAMAFALDERRVAILVDCNLRHPTQHLSLGLRGEQSGLFDYLERPTTAIDRLVRPTSIPGLHLIPAGKPPPVFREYFSSHAMRVVLTALSQPSCYVFLDAPPTKGSPDARILSDLANFVILVVGYGSETSEGIAQAAALFDPTKFAGVVFNERS